MEPEKEIFADGVGELALVEGMFRMDLVSLSMTKKDDQGRPLPQFRQRVVMSPNGFLRSYAAMQRLVNQLVEAGVLEKREGESTPRMPGADLQN